MFITTTSVHHARSEATGNTAAIVTLNTIDDGIAIEWFSYSYTGKPRDMAIEIKNGNTVIFDMIFDNPSGVINFGSQGFIHLGSGTLTVNLLGKSTTKSLTVQYR